MNLRYQYVHPFFTLMSFLSVGHECKSIGNRFEANIYRSKPVQILSDLDFHFRGYYLLSVTAKLLEQGILKTCFHKIQSLDLLFFLFEKLVTAVTLCGLQLQRMIYETAVY